MGKTLIKTALVSESELDDIFIQGWVRTRRDSKGFSFAELNDGSCLKNIQVIFDSDLEGYDKVLELTTGSAVGVHGRLVSSPGKGQKWEVQAKDIEVYGLADDSYPLQKKGHGLEFLREISHLRPRTNLFGSIFRVRSRLSFAIHNFFNERNFYYVHTPIITGSDCEGAGEMFQVTTLDMAKPPLTKLGKVDRDKDFFGKPSFLTVSGQLQGEVFATALSQIYTFGPTFRAENSNTPRHVSEFWMVEPEMAFVDLAGDMDLAEEFLKFLVADIRENCFEELELFSKFVDKSLLKRLEAMAVGDFKRISYEEALKILKSSGKKFEFPTEFGNPLQTEHEKYLTDNHFKKPVIVYNYPKECKPFYMRQNDDGKTVAAMDVLLPGIGEIIGGSQREERLNVLVENIKQHELSPEEYSWYIDTRKYGTVPHSGFGLGFERMLMYVTGVANIRDVIPSPRTPRNCGF